MATVGGVSCTLVKEGHVLDPSERIEVWQRVGMNGYGAHLQGEGDSSFAFLAIKYGSRSVIEAWSREIIALRGTIVTIDDDSVGYTNLLITTVGRPRLRAAWRGDGAEGKRYAIRVEGVVVGDSYSE